MNRRLLTNQNSELNRAAGRAWLFRPLFMCSLFVCLCLQASHTGMRSYIYSKNSVIGSQAEHGGMRTYFFSADTQEDMNGWIRAMNQAALMQSHSLKRSGDTLLSPFYPQFPHTSPTLNSDTGLQYELFSRTVISFITPKPSESQIKSARFRDFYSS